MKTPVPTTLASAESASLAELLGDRSYRLNPRERRSWREAIAEMQKSGKPINATAREALRKVALIERARGFSFAWSEFPKGDPDRARLREIDDELYGRALGILDEIGAIAWRGANDEEPAYLPFSAPEREELPPRDCWRCQRRMHARWTELLYTDPNRDRRWEFGGFFCRKCDGPEERSRRLKVAPDAEAPNTIDAYRAWWSTLANRLSDNTVRTYRYCVLRAIADGVDPLTASASKLSAYLESFRNQHARIIRSALRDCINFYADRGFRPDNPLEEVKRVRESKRRVRRALSRDEVERMVISATWVGRYRNHWTEPRDAWAIVALYYTGLRPGELVYLPIERVQIDDPRTAQVFIQDSKTAYDRIVPLAPPAVEAFRELIGERTSGRVLHIGRQQLWANVKRAGLLAGIDPKRVRPYAMRHSFATHLLDAGVPPRVVADLLGHVDLKHTMSYTVPSDDQRRAAVLQLAGAPWPTKRATSLWSNRYVTHPDPEAPEYTDDELPKRWL